MEKNKITKIDENTDLVQRKGITAFHREGAISDEEVNAILQKTSEISGLSIFEGQISHAYESDFTKQTEKCPRCGAPTEQMLATFPYVTQTLTRQMTGPAGHFCTECPTVIVNDEILKVSKPPQYVYGGVFAVIALDAEMQFFGTLNGEKSVFILDEMEEMLGISNSVHKLPYPDDYMTDDFLFHTRNSQDVHKAKPISKAASDKKRTKAKQAKKARKQNKKK